LTFIQDSTNKNNVAKMSPYKNALCYVKFAKAYYILFSVRTLDTMNS